MSDMQEPIKLLEETLIPQGFCRKENVFLKVQAESVLCYLRFSQDIDAYHPGERVMLHVQNVLELGLESLYSEIPPDELTVSGCRPKYYIVNLIGEPFPQKLVYQEVERKRIPVELPLDKQIQILIDKGLPFIQSITSQEQLLRAMIQLEMEGKRFEVRESWQKYAPYLYIERYEEAGWIARNALNEQRIPSPAWNDPEKVISYGKTEQDKQQFAKYYRYMKLADRQDRDECIAFMRSNYEKNIKMLRKISENPMLE